jgi:PAS domain S-box-containing protein
MSAATATDFNKKSLNDLSDYFHAAPIALHITEADGTIQRTNLAELELLGYRDNPDDYIGRHVAEMHADSGAAEALIQRVLAGESVVEHEVSLVRRDGTPQKVLLYANARLENGEFAGIRCCTFPHPEALRPDIAELGALRDESIESRGLDMTHEQLSDTYEELKDFFENCPVAMHIVGGDGLVMYANKKELAAMGYMPDEYLGTHIATFHADQHVIDGMLTDLVGGTPLINFSATLLHKDGKKLPVMIYSNSRMREGSFLNTRCFTVPIPKTRKSVTERIEHFSWPRNEDFGFTIPGRAEAHSDPNPMTLALKYIASRKRPEESLGYLARVSQALGATGSIKDMLAEVLRLSVPFLADFVSVDLPSRHLGHCSTEVMTGAADGIVRFVGGDDPNLEFSVGAVSRSGESQNCFDLSKATTARGTELLKAGARSAIVVPLAIRGQCIGALTLLRENATSRRDFGPADLALSEELARRVSCALEIDRLAARA